jgi:SsrA-binding protein
MQSQIVAQNRKAKFDYFLEEKYEAGVVLSGTEVKSLRQGHASIAESHIIAEGDELFILNCYIPEYLEANRFNHQTRRPRKLLLHRKQINKLMGKVKTKGYTLIPTMIYFTEKNIAKIEVCLAKGKAKHDKRATLKEQEWQREKQQIAKKELY